LEEGSRPTVAPHLITTRGATMTSPAPSPVDTADLERRIVDMYNAVAAGDHDDLHFETGVALARRLGYPDALLAGAPPEAVRGFAGVGWYFDLTHIEGDEHVVDLGSGTGTDAFVAAGQLREGRVTGVDMTPDQIRASERVRRDAGVDNVRFVQGRIDALPLPDESADLVVSNGVINLCPDKGAVFAEAARVLRPGGRLTLADIVSARELKQETRASAELWAACIAGAIPEEDYVAAIEGAGLRVLAVRPNDAYEFVTDRALRACATYGVRSISLSAVKPAG
jgi:SAM-dependent methyltransferase